MVHAYICIYTYVCAYVYMCVFVAIITEEENIWQEGHSRNLRGERKRGMLYSVHV